MDSDNIKTNKYNLEPLTARQVFQNWFGVLCTVEDSNSTKYIFVFQFHEVQQK